MILNCLDMTCFMLSNIEVKRIFFSRWKYDMLFRLSSKWIESFFARRTFFVRHIKLSEMRWWFSLFTQSILIIPTARKHWKFGTDYNMMQEVFKSFNFEKLNWQWRFVEIVFIIWYSYFDVFGQQKYWLYLSKHRHRKKQTSEHWLLPLCLHNRSTTMFWLRTEDLR
jgi:hypothetical protein